MKYVYLFMSGFMANATLGASTSLEFGLTMSLCMINLTLFLMWGETI